MRDSGSVLAWDLDVPVLDKHSTGGVGDKVSLVLAPLVAACGAAVPMISGRGLGHTGGTLDKLDAIPGYVSQPDEATLRAAIDAAGCAVIGQTGEIAPADRRLYALRDATATVESIPLITASILSKKLAAGLDGLVVDVKTGSGAFLPGRERELADSLEAVAAGAGLRCRALLTDMDQVLGRSAGNAVEVLESIEFLRGDPVEPRLRRVTLDLTRALLELGGIDADPEAALASGAAAERFQRMVDALGGPADLVEHPDKHLPRAPIQVEVSGAGTVSAIDVRAVGLAVVELGGGRVREDAPVDHAVGLTDVAGLGEDAGRLCTIHARDDASAHRAADRIRTAYDCQG